MNFISWQVIWKRIKAIRFFMKDKTVPLRKKLLILLGIVYLVSPIDLIPAPVLIFGLVDDLVLWIFILNYLAKELDRYWLGEKEVDPNKKYRGKNIIYGVEFEVADEEKQGQEARTEDTREES